MGRVFGVVRRVLWTLVIVLIVAVTALGSLLVAVTLRGLPTTKGSLVVAGLDRPVNVSRDANGIAWIEAEDPHDLFLAQGYVHAQERMWQMEVWRHISSGRLSELFGASTVDQDRFIRTLGWRQAAERDLAALSPDARNAVDDYAEGVNAWITAHDGSLAMPFVVTGLKTGTGGIGGYHLEPWTAVDTLAWQKVQAWDLGGNLDSEIFRMLADAELGDPARTDELFPGYDPAMPVITPSGLKGSGGAGATATGPADPATAAAPRSPASARPPAAVDPGDPGAWRDLAATSDQILATAGLDTGEGLAGDHQVGSNNWVVGPSKTASKTALLANDPHLGIGMPSVWFMNGLRCRSVSPACPYHVAGVSFPGVPGVILGHNDHIAWGATNVDPDVQDLFTIDPDPSNAANYLDAGKSVPFEVRHETIEVAGAASVELDVRLTKDGPILNDVDPRLKDAPLLAFRWTATDDVDGTFESIFRINTAATFEEFHDAFKTYGSPSQNFVYADTKGHIGYVLPGRIPIRADPNDHGDRIRSGSDGKHDWTGTIPFEDLPWQLDPPSGMIVSANNAAVDAKYPHFIAAEWDPGFRAERITQLLTEAAKGTGVTTQTLRDIQVDTRVTRAEKVVPFLNGVSTGTADGALVAERIAKWTSLDCPLDSVGCGAYLTFEYRLLRGLFDDDLGDLARDYVGSGASWQALLKLLDDPKSRWWDDQTTADKVETRDDIIAAALDQAGKELRAAYGEPDKWTWGAMHQARFEEQTLGTSGIGPLEWYFDKGPFPAPGAAGAVNNTYYRPSRAYRDPDDPSYVPVGIDGVFSVTNLPSYRLSIDLGNLDGAQIVQTTGQSGNPFDKHYGDLIGDWLTGVSVPLPFSATAVNGAAVERLDLVPGG
ncbi:MAG TPA: penicillin acylase family protein [Candidatus Limnocylindrales bacterium]|nr:penicillin acylase family protein [Candidatus Limnocylindrales bacterium]